jgi:hypothetical protein
MATPINYAEMFSDPEFLRQMQEAQAAAVAQTPMQPQVQGIEAPSMSASFSMTEMPKSEKDIQNAIRQKFMESQAQQEEQMKQQKALLAQEMERQKQLGVLGRLDLRPFAQALQQYGSTTAVVPTSAPTDRLDAIKQLQEQVQRGQRGLTQDQIGFLRTMMEDKRNAQAALSQGNQDIRIFQDIKKSYNKPIEDINTFYQAHDVVNSALESGDVTAIQSALSNYARMSGEKGVLTDQDIIRVMPSNLKTKAAKWWSAVSSDPTVQAPADVVEALRKGLIRLKSAAETKTKKSMELIKSEAEQGPGVYPKYAKSLYSQAVGVIRPHEMTEEEKLQKELEELKKVK